MLSVCAARRVVRLTPVSGGGYGTAIIVEWGDVNAWAT